MKNTFPLFIALLAFVACNPPTTKPESPATPPEPVVTPQEATAPPDSAAMMQAWMDYATPGDMHAMLAKDEGEWNGDITIWMEPGKPPTHNTGTAVFRMILGGLYQESVHTGSFDGMPFEGRNIIAFDNVKNKFISTWIDNMGSGVMVLEGAWDAANKTINYTGKQVDPVSGKEMDIRETVKIIDDNTQEMAMFMKYPGGDEFQSMAIKMTRKVS